MTKFINLGAIILCGGKSSRMNADKALLPFGNETMLERVLRIVGSVVDSQRLVVVAGANQQLPLLENLIVRDSGEHQGPLQAIACGFASLPPGTDAVFVTACDTPLLDPALIEYLFEQLADVDAVVPQDAERLYALCAIYRTSVVGLIEQQLQAGRHALYQLFEQLNANRINWETLREIDPELLSFTNVNTREDYLWAVEAAGLSTP